METRRVEDLAFLVKDLIETSPSYQGPDAPAALDRYDYERLSPIIVSGKNDLLDGYHRLAGLVAAGVTGEIDVIAIYDESLAGRLAEPGPDQDEALEELEDLL
jgi:hypothetical protein